MESGKKLTVKYSKLKAMMRVLNKTKPKDDDDVSFEFIVGSLFPNAYENIKNEMTEIKLTLNHSFRHLQKFTVLVLLP